MALTPEELQQAWIQAKIAEENAKINRLAIEQEILNVANLKDSGTNHFGDLKIITGYTQTWDQEEVDSIIENWEEPSLDIPFNKIWKPDSKLLKELKENHPERYKELAKRALTLKEKKPSFSLKEKKNDSSE